MRVGEKEEEQSPRKVIHIDMDCFYAAVEVKHNPRLKGKAIAIGGPPNSRGVLCTASYEARKFGVRSAMPSSHAARLCPQLIFLPPQFDLYREESEHVHRIMSDYTDKIEPLSLDEAYLDVSGSTIHKGSATLIAQEIRQRIYKERKLTASAGVAPNKLIAKIASDWNKPNGLKVVPPHEVGEFISPLKIEKIHGVGRVTAEKMHQHQIFTCADLQKRSEVELIRLFGSMGTWLYGASRGWDDREVVTEWERKSVSVEETFDKDMRDPKQCEAFIPQLYQQWDSRMQSDHSYFQRIKSIAIKMKFNDFKQTTCESGFVGIPRVEDFIQLFKKSLNRATSEPFRPIRLLGIGTKLRGMEEVENNSLQLSLLG